MLKNVAKDVYNIEKGVINAKKDNRRRAISLEKR